MDPLVTHYDTLIADVDSTLKVVRPFWMEARDDKEKRQHMNRINDLLDQRIVLMAKRDAAKASTT